jgi:putative addiction module killer protein
MEVRPFTVRYFCDGSGFCPFTDWMDGLKDRQARAIIRSRLDRVESGQLGDWKPLRDADGVCELKFRHGSAIRIYFGKVGKEVILLLCGGDKGTQDGDIEKAKRYWRQARKSYA